MKTIIAVGILLAQVSVAGAAIRHFNPEVFGKSADEPIRLLLPGDAAALHPISVLTDIKEGRYIAATVNYPRTVSFESIRSEINLRHKEYERIATPKMGLWKNLDDGYSIFLSEDDYAIKVAYVSLIFKGPKELIQHVEDIYPDKDASGVLGLDQAESEQSE